MSRRLSLSPAQRAWLDTGLRVVAAVFGGYVLTYAATAALARFDAAMVATLLSFALYTGFVLWAFAAVSVRRVWLGIALSLPLAAVGFWPVWFGGVS
ncbi:iron transporter [Azotobacter chroococcum]|uniref:iron transporter n=1 Tax=Azotobacter chroococcum TaxID=353 RepID=UPI001E2EC9CF|nr:iron transporter [Azotobacter chroococcum]